MTNEEYIRGTDLKVRWIMLNGDYIVKARLMGNLDLCINIDEIKAFRRMAGIQLYD